MYKFIQETKGQLKSFRKVILSRILFLLATLKTLFGEFLDCSNTLSGGERCGVISVFDVRFSANPKAVRLPTRTVFGLRLRHIRVTASDTSPSNLVHFYGWSREEPKSRSLYGILPLSQRHLLANSSKCDRCRNKKLKVRIRCNLF